MPSSRLLLLLLLVGCAPFAPVSGEWTVLDRFVTADGCGLTEGLYEGETFSLSYRGEQTFFLVYEEDVRVCTLADAAFSCNGVEEVTGAADAEVTLTRSFSGSFPDELTLTLVVDSAATCAGAGCAALGHEEGAPCEANLVLDLASEEG